jgi:hypothetical protein
MEYEPLSREFLLKRGYCCNNGCKNCPYKKVKIKKRGLKIMKNDRLKKMFTKDAITGWVIVALFFVFVGISIEPARENPEEFFYIMAIVLGGGIGSGVIMMWFFETFLPGEKPKKGCCGGGCCNHENRIGYDDIEEFLGKGDKK